MSTFVPLNKDNFKSLLQTEFSEEGSNQHRVEEQAWINFVDFLDECEGEMYFLRLLIVHAFKSVFDFRIL